MPATYEPIATTTLGTAVTSYTFSSIPATYTDLRLVFVGSGAAVNVYLGFRFNSDASAIYSLTYLSANGATASSGRITSNSSGYMFAADNIDTTISMAILDVFNYAGSTYKTSLATYSGDRNGSGYVERNVNLYSSATAINSITIRTDTLNNFAVGSTFTLYGIKAA